MNGGHYGALARAETLIHLERWREALGALGPALADDETAVSAYCFKAQCHLGLGQLRDAEAAARRAAGLAPQDEWPHRLLALTLLKRGKAREAEREAAEAARLEPESPHTLHVLALSQLNSSRGQRKAAKQTAEAAIAANPHSSLSHHTAAIVAMATGDSTRAESAYREALRLDPNNSALAIGLAEALRAQGRREEAADVYLAAGRADPTNAEVRHGLGKLGVPVIGGGALFAIKAGVMLQIPRLTRALGDPRTAGITALCALAFGCAVMLSWRTRGTRDLPEPVREGLRADHVDHALMWVFTAGLFALALALWAALAPPDKGGGASTAAVFVVLGGVAIAIAIRRSSRRSILSHLGGLPRFWYRRIRS